MAPREVRRLQASEARRLPWKNGRGVTREIALGPDGAGFERGDFDWRVSAARVEEPGPFSAFAGFDRTLVVTEGAGLILEHGEAAPRTRVRRMEPYRFSGDWPTRCELVAGAVADFNVLARRGKWRAEVLALELGRRVLRESAGADVLVVHVLRGKLSVRVSGEEDPFDLEAGDSLQLAGLAAHDELECAGSSESCSVIVTRLRAEGR